MVFISSRYAWYVLFAIALGVSRTTLLLFDDPEGPNLLIVFVLASVLFGLSLVVYLTKFSLAIYTRLLLGALIQIAVATVLYVVLS
jgi:FtsH-binding integral membrane protein